MKEDKSSNAILIVLIIFVAIAIFTFQQDDDLLPKDSAITTYDGYDYSYDDEESDFEKWLKTNGQILSSNSFYEEDEQNLDNWFNYADNSKANEQKNNRSSETNNNLTNNISYNPYTNNYSNNSNQENANVNNDFNNSIYNNINNEENNSNYNVLPGNPEPISTQKNILKYYYSQLDSNQQSIYAEIEKGCSKNQSTIKIDKAKIDDFTIASYAISMDHPEFFWTSSYSFKMTSDNKVVEVTYSVPSNIENTLYMIDTKANQILKEMSSKGIVYDKDKVRYFYEWIINNTDYEDNSDAQNITSVFITNKSVCAGYSRAFLYLCQKANIECAYVSGYTKNNEKHAWNLVKLGNNYYWVDTTWGDPVYAGETSSKINYNYFLVDDNELFKNHVIEYSIDMDLKHPVNKKFTYPKCLDDSLNYYKLNGSYFEEYNLVSVSRYIQDKFKKNIYDGIEFKFKEKYQYDAFIYDFLQKENAHIFDDVKAVNSKFHGTVSISYETIESANYIKVYVTLTRS